jgi:hypothetical protein
MIFGGVFVFWMVEWWTGFGKTFLDQRLITLKNKLINQ